MGAVSDLRKKGMSIGFPGQGAEITIFMRCVEYTEFFDRFLGSFGVPMVADDLPTVDTLDLSGKLTDPPRQAKALAWWLTTSAAAGFTSLNVVANEIGDGADALVGVFEQSDKIRTMLGIDEGTEVLDLSESQRVRRRRQVRGRWRRRQGRARARVLEAVRWRRHLSTFVMASIRLPSAAGMRAGVAGVVHAADRRGLAGARHVKAIYFDDPAVESAAAMRVGSK